MRCDEAESELSLGGRAPDASAELDAHLGGCASCRALAERHGALNAVLAVDEPHRPGPGFDTRFFARLAEERAATQKKRTLFSLRMWLWALVPAVAGVALLVARPKEEPENGAPAALVEAFEEPDDLTLMMEADPALLEDLDIVQQLDELEDLELLEGVDQAELERIAAEATP